MLKVHQDIPERNIDWRMAACLVTLMTLSEAALTVQEADWTLKSCLGSER